LSQRFLPPANAYSHHAMLSLYRNRYAGFRFPIESTSSWRPWHTKYSQHPNRHIFINSSPALCCRCYRLELHMTAGLSAWLYWTHGINYPPMFSLWTACMFFIRDWRQLFTATFGDKKCL